MPRRSYSVVDFAQKPQSGNPVSQDLARKKCGHRQSLGVSSSLLKFFHDIHAYDIACSFIVPDKY